MCTWLSGPIEDDQNVGSIEKEIRLRRKDRGKPSVKKEFALCAVGWWLRLPGADKSWVEEPGSDVGSSWQNTKSFAATGSVGCRDAEIGSRRPEGGRRRYAAVQLKSDVLTGRRLGLLG